MVHQELRRTVLGVACHAAESRVFLRRARRAVGVEPDRLGPVGPRADRIDELMGRWLMQHGEVPVDDLKHAVAEFTPEEIAQWTMVSDTPVGRLRHMSPTIGMSETQPFWDKPTVPLGHHQPVWPAR